MDIQFFKKHLGIKKSYPFEFAKWMLTKRAGSRVLSGLFKGMYTEDTHVGEPFCPRLLGIYEKELHCVIESIIEKKFDLIVDVGAAEGYYAVGLAMRSPESKIVAFEMSDDGCVFISKMAKINGVNERVGIEGKCELGNLSKVLSGSQKKMLIIDVEGAEIDLLEPLSVTALKNTEILVELHDQFNPLISKTLFERFEKSHDISTIHTQERTFKDIPFSLNPLFSRLFAKWIKMLIGDSRGVPMSWYWMVPKVNKA